MRTHQQLDLRSLQLHQQVAAKIRDNPALLEKAKVTLARWRATASPHSFGYLDEWKNVLDSGLDACLALALDPGEYATAMRQASPLACLLSNAERFAFLRHWKQTQLESSHAPR
ncbi:MAG: hypothetical protein IPH35_01460 [Rhodoferax sp.]|nr:hypothetical protein [Rhodoferax sp.]